MPITIIDTSGICRQITMLYIQATSSGVLNQQKSFSLSQLALQDRRLLFHYTSQNNLLDKLFGFGLLVFWNSTTNWTITAMLTKANPQLSVDEAVIWSEHSVGEPEQFLPFSLDFVNSYPHHGLRTRESRMITLDRWPLHWSTRTKLKWLCWTEVTRVSCFKWLLPLSVINRN